METRDSVVTRTAGQASPIVDQWTALRTVADSVLKYIAVLRDPEEKAKLTHCESGGLREWGEVGIKQVTKLESKLTDIAMQAKRAFHTSGTTGNGEFDNFFAFLDKVKVDIHWVLNTLRHSTECVMAPMSYKPTTTTIIY